LETGETMKKEYDFSKAEQGRFYRPIGELDVPVYLERKVRVALAKTANKERRSVSSLVNRLLRHDIQIAESLTVVK